MQELSHPPAGPAVYQLRVAEQLDVSWEHWFDSCRITQAPDGTTLLRRLCEDQAALYGTIARLRDLGLTLLAVVRLGGDVRHDQGAAHACALPVTKR